MDKYLTRTMGFLNEVGITVRLVPGATGFAKHCVIAAGAINVDPRCRVSALLHEAGHLATVPEQYRNFLSGNVGAGQRAVFKAVSGINVFPGSPLDRAVVQIGDGEATAWGWAAGIHIGIPESRIIRNDEYSGEGSFIRLGLKVNSYLGINGLANAGFCKVKAHHPSDLPVYPSLAYWVHPVLDASGSANHG
ncbi:hypothetical protein PVE_R2G0299 [Pseudomonas veronii 1YdBTEX2]|uniref:Uncharacterized protein n=1 Tax=Pseudomonas veronii 1YdBTEX2 TaxID=1295141 RepID=A0A1D3K7N7_PSEVE|nr:hypothetical protein PVE_R2G0299 [Pseudomonas veronii 1YdBTEX2]